MGMQPRYTLVEALEAGWGDRAAKFAAWMNRVDQCVEDAVGMSVFDLPDYEFAGAFEAGDTPLDTAMAILAENGMVNE